MGVEDADNAGDARFDGQAAGVATGADCAIGRAVVGTVTGDDLLSARKQAGNLDGVFCRFRPAEGEKGLFQVARGNLGQQAAQFTARLGGKGGRGVEQAIGLFLDGRHHARVAVADVDVH